MGFEAGFTLVTIAVCFIAMASNRVAPDITLMGGLSLLLLVGILTPQAAFSGLSNEGVLTVAVLYIVVTGLTETGAIAWLGQVFLGRRPRSLSIALARLMLPVATMSALLNNTPVVAMFIPAVSDWAKKNQLSVSKLMMPLSYAAIVGGTCTLIGTSTNLVVNGLLITETELPGLGMFDLAWIGIPITLATFIYVLIAQKWLLPERRPAMSQFADVRKYMVEMLVDVDSPLNGKSIEEAGLRQLPGLYLVEIERADQVLPAVSPHDRIYSQDRLIFAGIVDSVLDLQKIRGLKPATDQVFKLEASRDDRCFVEAVVSHSCPIAGKTIREGKFRSLYNAAVIAVARDGEQIKKKIGDIALQAGDTLLLEAHPDFETQQKNSRDFYLVSRLNASAPPKHEKSATAISILVGMVILVSFGWLPMLHAALLAAGLMIITRCTRGRVARRSIDWQVLIVIAASFGMGNALESSGAASAIADQLTLLSGGNPTTALMLTFAATSIFTALATNNTAALLMFPIALATTTHMDVNFMPFAITIMIAASASFATPIGYQTNLMVYGPGGYHFSDYVKMGTPLTFLVAILTIILVPLIWPL
ncbi:MAG: SLC13 family permease [Gammaproteobacteria bacterium]|nr:SLC13 family permease [Gammaproteobacteria bacterium]